MLRKICLLTKSRIIVVKNPFDGVKIMHKTNSKYFFSSINHHPTIQKILNGQDISNTQNILTQIGGLDNKNRDIALKLVLKNIYTHKLPVSILSDDKFIKQALKSPLIYIDSLSYKLKELIRRLSDLSLKNDSLKQNQAYAEINQTFIVSFETLSKVPEQNKLKHQVLLYKRFADYNLLYLSKVVESNQKKDILLKCCEFYRKTAQSMDKLLKFESQKISNERQISKSSNQKQEQKTLRLNAIQESLRMLIETNAQNTIHLFKALNEIQDKSNENEYDNNVIQMLTNFERAIAWYIVLKGCSTHSIFYHRIKKIKIDLNNYYKRSILSKRSGQRQQDSVLEKEYSKELEALYTQTKQDLQKLSNQEKYVYNAQELSLLMLSIRVQGLKRLKIDQSSFKDKLFTQIQNILDVVANSGNRKAVSSKLGKTVTQILQNQTIKSDHINSK